MHVIILVTITNIVERGDGDMFEACYYTVEMIDGDYAHLKKVEEESAELKLVARALLPEAIVVGSKLKYEMLQYELV